MKIKCAAIIYNGKIFEGESHCKIGHAMLANGDCKRPFPGGDAQGFVTDDGNFVSREAGLKIAIEAGQVIAGETYSDFELFSEDYRENGKYKKGTR